MKREHFIILAIALFIFSSALDLITGKVLLTLRQPFAFLNPSILTIYPLTAVSVLVKTLALWLTSLLFLSLIKHQYLVKALILLLTSAVSELYSIQQLATNSRFTPLEWTLAFAFTGVGFVIPIAFFLIQALWHFLTAPETPPSFSSASRPKTKTKSSHLQPLNRP